MLPALVPYWAPQVVQLGPIPIDPWATLVCIGFVVGLEVARARGIKMGLDTRDVVDGALFIVDLGFVVGHLVHVIAYNPDQMNDPETGQFAVGTAAIALAKIWAGFSSNGGFLGAVLGTLLFYKVVRKRDFWQFADNAMYGFPFGYIFGRLGCFSVHDHIGLKAEALPWLSFLAVDFPKPLGPRFDVALIEALWLVVVALIFFVVNRRWEGSHGKFIALWCMTYAPVRFLLDFMRNTDLDGADARYLGLTPAQYGALAMFTAGCLIVWRLWTRRSSQVHAESPEDSATVDASS